ncbi:phosphoenolpyruvate--protein phosphotransferase [Fundidesulfovibrio putealis]|uniref:phosphoenolpyruvate--protein phosphotransferase n=1 Tax=Fundidesulfovibrio putealis TaxID=270496 RepID=UPI00040BE84A|nr:phosphoenolpyruvate--protein phosphotransferase [Fundidesulfovibrio putealis]
MALATLSCIPISAGIAIGKAYFINRSNFGQVPRQALAEDLVEEEAARLKDAFAHAKSDLAAIRERVPAELKDHALIIDSHLMIMSDPKLQGSALNHLTTLRINAEWALEKAVADLEEAFNALDDPYFRERAQDVRLVADRVRAQLMGQKVDFKTLGSRAVLLAHDLTPADTVELQVDKIMGFATVQGGKTSHAGILAKSLGIPAVVGAGGMEEVVQDGNLVIVDGLKGLVLVEPDEDELARYGDLKYQFESYRAGIIKNCHLPGETIDGYRIKVKANIELYEEVAQVIDNGGDGIGLFRTEYTYLNRTVLPTEEELFEHYRDLADILSPRRVILRTLDLGADKFMAHFGRLEEQNPAMGLRAVRFCLRHKGLFKTQIRAILRASVVGNISIMFPMISGLKELQQSINLLRECQQELRKDGLAYNPEMPVGMMVELPSAVMTAEIMAKEVDFFSIGTNDLIQYSLGIDRTNRHVSYLYQPLHPAVVRSIKHVVDAAHQAGIECNLCGEMASDPFCIPILMGMQIDAVSLNPQTIPAIKHIIRQTTMDDCKKLLKQVLDSPTVARTNQLVRETIFQKFPDQLSFFYSLLDSEEGPSQ